MRAAKLAHLARHVIQICLFNDNGDTAWTQQ
jgi:hypothetical protein